MTVPAETPFDRYDLVLKTSAGDEVSYGGVKVITDYKDDYYIMHFSDGHIFQQAGDHDSEVLLARKSAMITTRIDAIQLIGDGVVADPSVSINSLESVNNLSIYPNPAHIELQFEFVLEKPSAVDISLHDLTGRKIIQHHGKVELNAGSHQQTLNVSSIMPGSYFVKVDIDDAAVCNMVVIE